MIEKKNLIITPQLTKKDNCSLRRGKSQRKRRNSLIKNGSRKARNTKGVNFLTNGKNVATAEKNTTEGYEMKGQRRWSSPEKVTMAVDTSGEDNGKHCSRNRS